MRLFIFIVSISLSLSVHATRFYGQDGKTWIKEGDKLQKLYQHAGSPKNSHVAWECGEKRRCKSKDEVLVRTLYYPDHKQSNLRWIIKAYAKTKKNFSMEWTRK